MEKRCCSRRLLSSLTEKSHLSLDWRRRKEKIQPFVSRRSTLPPGTFLSNSCSIEVFNDPIKVRGKCLISYYSRLCANILRDTIVAWLFSYALTKGLIMLNDQGERDNSERINISRTWQCLVKSIAKLHREIRQLNYTKLNQVQCFNSKPQPLKIWYVRWNYLSLDGSDGDSTRWSNSFIVCCKRSCSSTYACCFSVNFNCSATKVSASKYLGSRISDSI